MLGAVKCNVAVFNVMNHPRSLISAFVVRCLDSIMPLVSISEISEAEQAGLNLNWSPIPEDTFSHDVTQLIALFRFLCFLDVFA